VAGDAKVVSRTC